MQQSEFTIEHGRRVIRREWRNTGGHLHRTTGPAVEVWTVLPGGGHVLSRQGWYVNGNAHRVDRPAVRRWHVAGDGTRVLEREEWKQHGRWHRVDGPACDMRYFWWKDRHVRGEDLPWLRRGHGFMVALTGGNTARWG